jgi:hypothetical protein
VAPFALALEEPDPRTPSAGARLDGAPSSLERRLEDAEAPLAPDAGDLGAFDFGAFEAPATDEPGVPGPAEPDAGGLPLAGEPAAGAGGVPAIEPYVASPAPTPPRRPPAHVAEPERPAPRARLGAWAINALSLAALLVVAAVLFAWWRGGMTADAAGGAELAAVAEATTVYDTAAGRPVLVVRGLVRSRAAGPVAGASVAVELLDGGRVVARGRAAPGALPTPEEVHAVDGAAAAERLAAAAAARAAAIPPGGSAPFLAVLADVPPGAERLELRVAVSVP